jgi:hypothetical protein
MLHVQSILGVYGRLRDDKEEVVGVFVRFSLRRWLLNVFEKLNQKA